MPKAAVIEVVRRMCLALPGATEDVKWGADLVFSVGGKMFTVVCLDPPHTVAFKCTPDTFAELVERDGVIPAPYLARAMWVQERAAGEVLERRELQELVATSYELVVATLPKSKRPGVAKPSPKKSSRSSRASLPASLRRRGRK